MVNIEDFRAFLIKELSKRQTKNPAYSLRAYARDLGMSSQKLGQVLKGRTGLSASAAYDLAKKIDLSADETEFFVALVSAKHARSRPAREAAQQVIKGFQNRKVESISPEEFGAISHWYDYAAYLLVELKKFKPDMDWVAATLGITSSQAIAAYEKLFTNKLLQKNSATSWLRTKKNITFSAKESSSHLRRFYTDMFTKATKSIETDPPGTRHLHVTMMAIEKSDYREIEKRINKFSLELLEEFKPKDQNADHLYSLSMAFFPLDQSEQSDKKE